MGAVQSQQAELTKLVAKQHQLLAQNIHPQRRTSRRQFLQNTAGAAVSAALLQIGIGQVEVRRAIIEALGEIEGSTAAETLIAAMKDTDVEVRRAAAEALGDRE